MLHIWSINAFLSFLPAFTAPMAEIYGAICEPQVGSLATKPLATSKLTTYNLHVAHCTLRLPNTIFVLTLTLICVAASLAKSNQPGSAARRWKEHSSFIFPYAKEPHPLGHHCHWTN